LIKVSEEDNKSAVDAIPKELPYSIEVKTPELKTETPKEQAPPAPAPTPTAQVPARVRHEWYQTDTTVVVDIFFKNIPKDKCTVEIEPESVNPCTV
jgi:CS domain